MVCFKYIINKSFFLHSFHLWNYWIKKKKFFLKVRGHSMAVNNIFSMWVNRNGSDKIVTMIIFIFSFHLSVTFSKLVTHYQAPHSKILTASLMLIMDKELKKKKNHGHGTSIIFRPLYLSIHSSYHIYNTY